MISEVVARRYAKALFLATPEGDLDGTARLLKTISGLLASEPRLQAMLTSPAVQPAKKRGIIDAIATQAGLSPLVTRFLGLLVDKARMDHMASVADAYASFVDDKLERVNAHVLLAAEPTGGQSRRITDYVKAVTGKQRVVVHAHVDPDILGGVVIRIGDQVYDASIRNELTRIEKVLAD